MVQFWLDNPTFLISTDNFKFNNPNQSEKTIQMLNIVALVSLIVGLFLVFKKKNAKYSNQEKLPKESMMWKNSF